MSLHADYHCDVCGAVGAAIVQQGNVLIPADWLLLTWDESVRVLPQQLDDAATAARNAPGGAFLGSWMEATMAQPFSTAFHVCPTCRETLTPLVTMATARLRERQEIEPPSPPMAPPTFASIHPLRPAPPVEPEPAEPPEKPYADCPLWTDGERIGAIGRCKQVTCLKTRHCQVMADSPLVFIHEDTSKKPRKP